VSIVLALLVALPAVVGLALMMLPALTSGRRGERIAAPVAIVAGLVTAGLAGAVVMARPELRVGFLPQLPVVLAVDDLSAVLVVTVAAIALAVLVFTAGTPEQGRARLFGMLLLFTSAMLVTVTAATLTVLLVAWELMGAASYALIGHAWREQHRVNAGFTAFLTTRLTDVGLYVAAGAALAAGVPELSLSGANTLNGGWAQVLSAGVVIAALGKSAQLPFSGWLSGAMLGPSPVSALLHSATMVAAGGYLLLRLHPVLAATGWAVPVAWVGAVTAVGLGAVALAQRDLKQLLAASTCSQLGFVVLAAGTGSIAGGVLALVAHAATKSLLFLCAGAWLDALGTKDLTALRGVGRRYPLVGGCAVLGALSLAGVPPLALWVGKDVALADASEHFRALYAVGLIAAVLSAAYGARLLTVILGRPQADARFDTEQVGTRRVSALARVPLPVLALGTVILGGVVLIPGWRALELPGPQATAGELVLSGVLAVATAGVVWTLARRAVSVPVPALLRTWLGTRVLWSAVGSATVGLGQALSRFDDAVIAGSVRTAASSTMHLADRTNSHVERRITAAVDDVAAGARRLGGLARRPQTGQLHTYYAQTLTALAVLAVVIVLVR